MSKLNDNLIAAIILTFNEEINIVKCINSISFCNTIIVLDSFSTDNTKLLAKNAGADIIERKFDNYSAQRNFALSSVPKKYSWILMVDADEEITIPLKNEILEVILYSDKIDMFRVRRKDFLHGKWLKYSSGYPTWFPRLFKNGKVKVKREINEEYSCNGQEAKLKGHLFHYPFSKGLNWWFTKHNKYSDMEAKLMLTEVNVKFNISNLFSSSPVVRRQAQKKLSYKIPFRPLFVFFAFYILRGGFLDGKVGYQFCKMRKIYETMIDLKFKALESKGES